MKMSSMGKYEYAPEQETLYGSIYLARVHQIDQNTTSAKNISSSRMMYVAFVLVVGIIASLSISSFNVYGDPLNSEFMQLFQVWPTNLPEGQTRTLMLLLHAKSSWEFPDMEDFDRPLNAKGVIAAKRLGTFLRANNFSSPDIILSSPSVRTRQTLSLVQISGWANHVTVVWDPNLFDFGDIGYLDYVKNIDDKYNNVMIVGHNPAIEELAQNLVGLQKVEHLPPGAFCVIQFQDSNGWSTLHHANLLAYIDTSKLT
jgi:phosphohistidine phosphatase